MHSVCVFPSLVRVLVLSAVVRRRQHISIRRIMIIRISINGRFKFFVRVFVFTSVFVMVLIIVLLVGIFVMLVCGFMCIKVISSIIIHIRIMFSMLYWSC